MLPTLGPTSRTDGDYLLFVEVPGMGFATGDVAKVASELPDRNIILATASRQRRIFPPNLQEVHLDSSQVLWSLVEGAAALLVGEREGYDPPPAGLVAAAQLLGIPVVGWTDSPGGVLASTVEESVTGFVADIGKAGALVAPALQLDHHRIVARAAGRLGIRRGIQTRLVSWARLGSWA